jgi:hypothetical protein
MALAKSFNVLHAGFSHCLLAATACFLPVLRQNWQQKLMLLLLPLKWLLVPQCL